MNKLLIELCFVILSSVRFHFLLLITFFCDYFRLWPVLNYKMHFFSSVVVEAHSVKLTDISSALYHKILPVNLYLMDFFVHVTENKCLTAAVKGQHYTFSIRTIKCSEFRFDLLCLRFCATCETFIRPLSQKYSTGMHTFPSIYVTTRLT